LSEKDPVEILRNGTALLHDLLARHGFSRAPIKSGLGSGGAFACTEFRRGDRRLELHFGKASDLSSITFLTRRSRMRTTCGRSWANGGEVITRFLQ